MCFCHEFCVTFLPREVTTMPVRMDAHSGTPFHMVAQCQAAASMPRACLEDEGRDLGRDEAAGRASPTGATPCVRLAERGLW